MCYLYLSKTKLDIYNDFLLGIKLKSLTSILIELKWRDQ
jgi:hypothetical protein